MTRPESRIASLSKGAEGTSGLGVLGGKPGKLPTLLLGGALALGTSAGGMAFEPSDFGSEYVCDYTNSGGTHWSMENLSELVKIAVNQGTTDQAAIHELRRRSGLTWDQIAELMGVGRRSVHFWASGKEASARNQEHLQRVLAAVRSADRGSASGTRSALLETDNEGINAFDLLKNKEHEQALRRLSRDRVEPIPHDRRFVKVVRPMGLPPSPESLVGALHHRVHEEGTRSRGVRAAKVKKKA